MVDRKDLRHFDGEMTRLILWAQEEGATVKMTKNGHAFILGPNGGSTTVQPKAKKANRGGLNAAANVRRLFRKDPS